MQNNGLTRALGFFDVLCLGINSVVGAGIFLLPGQLCSLAGSNVVWVFPLCGILCFAIALCFAEMGGMYHTTWGAYLYAKEAFGPFAGFLAGWMIWLSSIIGWASVASGFSLYAGYFFPTESVWRSKALVTLLVGGLSAVITGRWRVIIEDPAGKWRLQGDWQADGEEPLRLSSRPEK